MGKKHNDDNSARRGRPSGDRPSGNFGNSGGPRKFSSRPGEGGFGGNRSGNDGAGRDFSSRPSFGRSEGRPSSGGGKRFGGSEGGPRKFGNSGGPGSFGRSEGSGNRGGFGGPRRDGGDDRRSFGRDNDRSSSRRFEGREDRRDERPAQPYNPKANWPGQPYQQEGKPAVPRGNSGERNRKFNKVNPHAQPKPSMPEPPVDFRREERDGDTGPNRAIRPARPFDFRGVPEGFNREEKPRPDRRDDNVGSERRGESGFGREERRGAPDRRESGFGNRSFGERPSFGSKPYGDKGGARGDKPRAFGDKPAYGDKREARPFGERTERPVRPTYENRADKPKRGEVAGEAPEYKNLRHYEEDKTRGNKRRRDEDDSHADTTRLNRYIANAGICSRREADSLIAAGEIRVNGEVVTEMGYQVQPTDTVQYGKTNLKREKHVYVLLNKPKDYLTTTDDPEGRRTVMELVASASKERIFPVGRLDRNTTGLLLFTNDGEVAQKLSHPSHKNKKIYQVELNNPLTEEHLKQIAAGLELEDGKAEVDDVAVVAGNPHFVGIELHLGRNRIVRRIFEHLGYEVVTLDRVQYAGLTKKDLPRGKWRFLSEKEVIRLKYFL
ncbi:pseudouridine synthase [Hymenobacter cellulosivorans]|uniref:Pseudouridine synthase n=1 Tax=Hymenobacter cellulosivorans TaxID=2932249 RepID=A0ABY4FCB0_9BACT|nr:pseudouridine synthase [Hymenobacter cellulosivorans]UOQ54165.1 pseudouridine synthase [Hymenobacter cellulosivorans]